MLPALAGAALNHGIPFFAAPDDAALTHLTNIWDARRPQGTTVHRMRLRRDEIAQIDGYRVTTPLRTALDLALTSTPAWATVAFDTVARRRSGMANAREALPYVDPTAESALESLSRLAVVASVLPAPERGYPIAVGPTTYWADFAWPDKHVIGEADGTAKYSFAGAMERQARRQRVLEDAGWTVVRWTWDDVFPNPGPMLNRLNEVLWRYRRAA